MVNALNSFNGETRTLRYVLVPGTAAGAVPEPTDDDLKRYYDNHQTKFTQPEFRKIGVLAVTPETVKDQVQITEADLKAAFETTRTSSAPPRSGTSSRSPSPISPPPTPPIRRSSPAPISWRLPRSRV